MGGEKRPGRPRKCCLPGSPPRGRGKVVQNFRHTAIPGITPAWAGKRTRVTLTIRRAEDHPRVGGEKRVMLGIQGRDLGSPPRGRGKVSLSRFIGSRSRITPAWAGKRPFPAASQFLQKDHPRVGGEKHRAIFMGGGLRGITPAWAGKSRAFAATLQVDGDHPRVGGEKPSAGLDGLRELGSPPRGRGKGPAGAAP